MASTTIMIYATGFLVTFALTMLRGFQNKSVAGGHKRLAFIGGGVMQALENVVTFMLAHQLGDYTIILFTSTGSAFGWVAGMYLHDAMMRKRLKEAKRAKKTKRREQLEAMLDDRLKELGVI
jgi:hypothetical protein